MRNLTSVLSVSALIVIVMMMGMHVEYYDENPALLIYYSGKNRGVDVLKVAEILLCPELPTSPKVATEKPVAVSRSTAFVIDNRHLRDIKDVLSDSMGVWICTGTKTSYCSFRDRRVTATNGENYGEDDSIFKIERRFFKNKAEQDVKRNLTVIRSNYIFNSC